ncbi:MAG: zinc-dependent metalloprotease, partial [Acidimicrobiia bacterium]|nr:zinc-dependent metalloprotease [Acidimicrobiia bacterium]
PLTDKVGAQLSRSRGPVRVAQAITGAEVGTLLGWMSSRVLGQYDLLVLEEEAPEQQDLVYYVGPNVISVERRFGFPAEQFRLWLAIHETTHRAQFTGVPWMRQHYLGLVNELTGSFDPDPQRFLAMLRQSISALRSGETSTREGGLAAVFATPAQRDVMARIGGLMSLLEGHGDITMQRAGAAAIPSAERFARVLAERRKSQPGPTKVLQRLLGLEAKMAQYEQGERFVLAIEAAAGLHAVDTCWERAENLPTLQEIREPHRWLDRMGLASAA